MSNLTVVEELACSWQRDKVSRETLDGALDLLDKWRGWLFEPGDTFYLASQGEQTLYIVVSVHGGILKCRQIVGPEERDAVVAATTAALRGHSLCRAGTYWVVVEIKAINGRDAIRKVTRQLAIGSSALADHEKGVVREAGLVSTPITTTPAKIALANEWQTAGYNPDDLRGAMALLETWRNWEFKVNDTFVLASDPASEKSRRIVRLVNPRDQVLTVADSYGSAIELLFTSYRHMGAMFERGMSQYSVNVQVKAVTFQDAKDAISKAFESIGMKVQVG